MSLVIAIDGACRRNGQPDCVASGGVFISQHNDNNLVVATRALSNYEIQSTNQRGELLALLTALDYIYSAEQSTLVVTDSEYLFNAMTKQWYTGWQSRGWRTASEEPVKNSDLWKEIKHAYEKCVERDIEITFYHIKGHCIPFGKVTANTLLSRDHTGNLLCTEAYKKYDEVHLSKLDKLKEANEVSFKNNGFYLEDYVLRNFVVINTVADAIATKCVDAANSLMK